jgi:hypothetical protein
MGHELVDDADEDGSYASEEKEERWVDFGVDLGAA